MVQLQILRDNREQTGWDFTDFDAQVSGETITTGDYTLVEFCDHEPDNDTYFPQFAVERKSGEDFVSSVTRDRDRFLAEIKRASEWTDPLPVLIEDKKHCSNESVASCNTGALRRLNCLGRLTRGRTTTMLTSDSLGRRNVAWRSRTRCCHHDF